MRTVDEASDGPAVRVGLVGVVGEAVAVMTETGREGRVAGRRVALGQRRLDGQGKVLSESEIPKVNGEELYVLLR